MHSSIHQKSIKSRRLEDSNNIVHEGGFGQKKETFGGRLSAK